MPPTSANCATPGDFITRDVGGRNLIIQRRADGEPAVYLNACAHRGAKVCAERQGNSQRFTCPYHDRSWY